MKSIFSGFLTAQDHFGISPNYLINGKRKFHTLICEIISLIMNCGCIAMLITLVIELASRNKPTVNNVSIQLDKGPNATLNSKNLIIAFGVLDSSYQIFNDPTVFTLEANYEVTTIYNDEFTNRVSPLKRINCTEINGKEYTEYGYENIFISNNLANYYCYNETDIDKEIVVGGNFGSEFYGVISVTIRKCSNETGIECKTDEEIDKILKGTWFEVFFLDHYIDIYNYSNPIQTYSNSYYTMIEPTVYKILTGNYNKLLVKTDNGLLFSTNKEEVTYKSEKLISDIKFDIDRIVLEYDLIISMSEDIFYRSYIKIQGICANIGGILSGMNIIGVLVLSFFESKLYEIQLINDIFEFHQQNLFVSMNTIKQDPSSRPSALSGSQKRITPTQTFGNKTKSKVNFDLSIWQFICYKGLGKKNNTHSLKSETGMIIETLNKILEFSKNVLVQNELNLLKSKKFEQENFITGLYRKDYNLYHNEKIRWVIGSKFRYQKKFPENCDESQKVLSSKMIPIAQLSNNDFTYEGNSKVMNIHNVNDFERSRKK